MYLTPKNNLLETIIKEGKIETAFIGDTTTIVKFTTKEGTEFIETNTCSAPEYFSESIGVSNCLERIKNKIWAYEEYKFQKELYDKEHPNKTFKDKVLNVYTKVLLVEKELDILKEGASNNSEINEVLITNINNAISEIHGCVIYLDSILSKINK